MPRKEGRFRPSSVKRDKKPSAASGSNDGPLEPQPHHPNPLDQPAKEAYQNLMPENISATLRKIQGFDEDANQRATQFENSPLQAQLSNFLFPDNGNEASSNPMNRSPVIVPEQGTATSKSTGNSNNISSKSSRHHHPSSHSHSVSRSKSVSPSNSVPHSLSTHLHSNSTSHSESVNRFESSSDPTDKNSTFDSNSESTRISACVLKPATASQPASTSMPISSSQSATSSDSNAHHLKNDFVGMRIDDGNAESSSNARSKDEQGASHRRKRPAPNEAHNAAEGNCPRLNHKSTYVGIGVNTIRSIWHQGVNDPINIPKQTMQMMAEDTSYKLWELIDSLRVYSLHSGGVLTKHIVNEVLKDFNVPPITYADTNKYSWEKIEYKGEFYAKPKMFLSLRMECSKQDWVKDFGSLGLEAEWRTPIQVEAIKNFLCTLVACAMLGSEETFSIAIKKFGTSPFVGSVSPALVTKVLEFLSFDPPIDQLKRALDILKTFAHSYYARDVTVELKQFHISNVLVCLLFGRKAADEKRAYAMPTSTTKVPITKASMKSMDPSRKELREKVLIPWTKWQQQPNRPQLKTIMKKRTARLKFSQENLINRLRIAWDHWISIMPKGMASNLVKEKSNRRNSTDPFHVDCDRCFDSDDPGDSDDDASSPNNCNVLINHMEVDNVINDNDDASPETGKTASSNSEWDMFRGVTQPITGISKASANFESAFCTSAVDDSLVDDVVALIGYLSGMWGHVEHEIIHLLNARMQYTLLRLKPSNWTDKDIDWLVRMLKVTVAMGDFAFRELCIYFERLPHDVPEAIRPYFSVGAQFVNRHDGYMYEFLDDMCGDALQPFLIEYPKYLDQLRRRINKRRPKQLPIESGRLQLFVVPRPPNCIFRKKNPMHPNNSCSVGSNSGNSNNFAGLGNNENNGDDVRIEDIDDENDMLDCGNSQNYGARDHRTGGSGTNDANDAHDRIGANYRTNFARYYGTNYGTNDSHEMETEENAETDAIDRKVKKEPVMMDAAFSECAAPVPMVTSAIRFRYGKIDHVCRRTQPARSIATEVPTQMFNRQLVIRRYKKPVNRRSKSNGCSLYDCKLYHI